MYLWDHIRHRSGFAVHSPFMYGVVRKAMMPRRIVGPQSDLHKALLAQGCNRRAATRLQNYHTHLGYTRWGFNEPVEEGLVIITPDCSEQQVRIVAEKLSDGRQATLCILHCRNKAQRTMAEQFVANHSSMSASKNDFTLLVYGKKLPKQHIIL